MTPSAADAYPPLATRLEIVQERLQERLTELLVLAPLLVIGVLILILFWGLAVLLTRWEGPFRPLARNPFVRELIRSAVRGGIFLVGVLLVLELLELTTLIGAVLGAAGLMGLALGFAFRDVIENYIASVLLSLRQPFLPNDHVVIDGHEGRIVRLTSRATILMTLDGNHLRIPNAAVFKAVIVNYSRNPRRRLVLTVGVGVDEDLDRVQRLGIETLSQVPGVLEEPPPLALIDALGDSNVHLRLAAWVDQEASSFSRVRSEALRRLKEAFDRAGVAMPEPAYVVRLEHPRAAPTHSTSRPSEPVGEPGRSPEAELEGELARDRERGDGEDLLHPEAPKE